MQRTAFVRQNMPKRTEMSDRETGQLVIFKQELEEEIERLLLETMDASAILPLSYFSPIQVNSNSDKGSISGNRHKDDEASRALTLLKERIRREQMSEKFSVLKSIVPILSKHSKREEIVTGTVNYIKYLEGEIKRLEGLKKECQWQETKKMPESFLSRCTNQNPSANVSVSNGATFLSIQLPSRQGLVLEIAKVLEKNRVDVMEARVNVDDEHRLLTFTATMMLGHNGGITIEKIKQEILAL